MIELARHLQATEDDDGHAEAFPNFCTCPTQVKRVASAAKRGGHAAHCKLLSKSLIN